MAPFRNNYGNNNYNGGNSGYGNYQAPYQNNGGGNSRPAYNGPRRAYNGNGGGGYSNGGAPKKNSGCKVKRGYTVKATGEQVDGLVISGWIKRYGEFISYVGVANKNPDTKRADRKRFVMTITPGMGQPYKTTGFYDTDKKVLRMPDLNLYCDPNRDFTYKISKRKR